MAILTRISRLFRADLHALLDYLEEPEILLRQALREMEEEIDQGKHQLLQLQKELTATQDQIRKLDEKIPQLQQEVTACFESENSELAKNFIRRKLENQTLLHVYTDRVDELNTLLKEKRQILSEQQTTYDGLKQKADLLIKNNKHWSKSIFTDRECPVSVMEDQVELEFLKEQKNYQQNKFNN